MKFRINLQLFEDGAGAGSAGQGVNSGADNGSQGNTGGNINNQNPAGNNGGTGTFSFEQAEAIAEARAHRASQAALRSYFQQQGMSPEEVTQAIAQFRQQRELQQPNVTQIEQERDTYKKQVEQMQNERFLTGKGVRSEDLDYVVFKIGKMVDDKTDFKKAAEKYLKENPRYTGQTYRVSMSTSTQSDGNEGNQKEGNDFINAAIRKAAGR